MNQEFPDCMREHGFEPPNYPIPTGKYFRFGRNYSCWGFLFEDGMGGVFGSWKTGERYVWQSPKSKRTPYEREQFAQHLKAVKAIEDAKREEAYGKASDRAREVFDGAGEADPSHHYLVTKRIKPHGIKQDGDKLLIPVYSVVGEFQSLQTINPRGNKRFFAGGKMAGGCHMIGQIKQDKPIVIVEGYATACSLHEDDDRFVVVAFNAGNLLAVAKDLREQFPDMEIVIAGDDDPVGRKSAEEASKAIGGKAIFPPFKNKQEGQTDWNDFLNMKESNE